MAKEHQQGSGKPTPVRFRIGDLVLDTGKLEVTRDGEVLDVAGLSLDLLLTLAGHAPNVATHDILIDEVWGGRVISPETITQRVKLVRQALGDDADQPKYIGSIRNRGYRLLVDVERLGPAREEPARGPLIELGRRRDHVTVVVAAALLVGAATGFFYLVYPRFVDPGSASLEQAAEIIPNSIVVLPLSDLSPDGDQAYFAEGIAEEMLKQISALDGIAVVGRAQSFQYRNAGLSPIAFARQLGVEYVLDGSVRKQDTDLRISVDLLDVASGLSVWSQTYDRELLDVFAIQEDIALSIAAAFSIAVDVDGQNRLPASGTDSLEAYDALLAGRALFRLGRGSDAIRHYERARELDPDYAQAWAAAARGKLVSSWDHPPEQAKAIRAQAMSLVEHALELEPDLAEAWHIMVGIKSVDHDFVGAAEADVRRRALSPGAMDAHLPSAGFLSRVGRTRQALALRESLHRGPIAYYSAQAFAEMLIQAERYDDALEVLEVSEAINRSVSPWVILRKLFIALSRRDRDAIRKYLAEFDSAHPADNMVSGPVLAEFDATDDRIVAILRATFTKEAGITPDGRILIASLAAYFGDHDLALEALWAEMRHNTIRVRRLWYPFFSGARRLPEFKKMVKDIGLVEYWRKYAWPDTCRPVTASDFECW